MRAAAASSAYMRRERKRIKAAAKGECMRACTRARTASCLDHTACCTSARAQKRAKSKRSPFRPRRQQRRRLPVTTLFPRSRSCDAMKILCSFRHHTRESCGLIIATHTMPMLPRARHGRVSAAHDAVYRELQRHIFPRGLRQSTIAAIIVARARACT